jgi:hypothetical protein
MKSFVIFMTSKNDLQQRDETLFAIKFRRAELAFPERSANDHFRSRLMLPILPRGQGEILVTESVDVMVLVGAWSMARLWKTLIPRHCRSR